MKQPCLACVAAAALASPAFAETQSFDLAGFTRVSAAAGTTVNVSVGGGYSVVAESTPEGLARLRVEIKGDELRLGRRPGRIDWGRSARVVVNVTLPALSGLDVSSGASLTATGVDAGAFSIDASAGGSVDVTGRCEDLDVDVSSGGNVDAGGLECRSAVVDASSGGKADIFASASLTGEASSGGSIDVHGKPGKVSRETSSGGSIAIE
jgi:hypothetical protein